MEKIKDAVCLIECMDKKKQEVEFTGTGFYYGDGWVMTAAHIFQDDENDDNASHSYLSEGKFRVLFHVGGKKYVFPQRKRTAFVHHLNPGEYVDEKNKDIAMVKLGIQYDKSVEDWEEEEAKKFAEMNPFAFAQMDPPVPNVGDDVYAIYNGDDGSKVEEMIKIKRISEGETDKVPMLHLRKEPGVLPEGASGCPVMLEKVTLHRKYHLVGLHFSGDSDKKDGEAQALRWKKGIADYVQQGVEAIGAFKPYLTNTALAADKASNPALQKSLEEQAEEYKKSLNSISEKGEFTIYLKKGEDLLKIP